MGENLGVSLHLGAACAKEKQSQPSDANVLLNWKESKFYYVTLILWFLGYSKHSKKQKTNP